MKTWSITLLILIFSLSLSAQEQVKAPKENGDYKEKSGKIILCEGKCKNGFKTGTWKYNSEFGLLIREEDYSEIGILLRERKQNSITSRWEECNYQNGKRNGQYRISFNLLNGKDDELILSGYYKDDLKDSIWYFYRGTSYWKLEKWSSGILKQVSTFYLNGNLFDIITIDTNGNILTQVYYSKNGEVLGKDDKKNTADSIVTLNEVMPSFPGGEEALFAFIRKNLRYPAFSKDKEMQGTVLVSFTINQFGKPENVKVTRGVLNAADLDAEALRIIEMMPPWSPGMVNGRKVKVTIAQPVKFVLQ